MLCIIPYIIQYTAISCLKDVAQKKSFFFLFQTLALYLHVPSLTEIQQSHCFCASRSIKIPLNCIPAVALFSDQFAETLTLF